MHPNGQRKWLMGNDNNIILGSGDIAEARAFAHDVVAQKAPGAG